MLLILLSNYLLAMSIWRLGLTGPVRNAFDAVGIYTFPRAIEVETYGRGLLQQQLAGLATDSVSADEVMQVLLPAYMKDYRTLWENADDRNIQREMGFIRRSASSLQRTTDKELWNCSDFSEHIMREIMKGTTCLLTHGELTGSANTMATLLAGGANVTTTTAAPSPDWNTGRDGKAIILPRSERVALPHSWPVQLSVDSYITVLQRSFGEQLGKDPYIYWVNPNNPHVQLPQDKCSLRHFLMTPFDHQLFHANSPWSPELRNAVRLYRMSGSLRPDVVATSAPIGIEQQQREIEQKANQIGQILQDSTVENKRGEVKRWLQQQSTTMKPEPDATKFSERWLSAFSRAYGNNLEVWSQKPQLNLDVMAGILKDDQKTTLSTSAQQVIDRLQSELGKRLPINDMLHLPAERVAENLVSQYANTQANGILAALVSPPPVGTDWPAGVTNVSQLHQDIRTWHDSTQTGRAFSQQRYNNYVLQALQGSIDTQGGAGCDC
ncbi:hypothetical protein QRZ34_28650 [Klebsiella michiganensis]|uniref:hypothetical protein n=1 Tax=Klebsiella michiganensis TaxID=1134687 RepID=UPI0025706040|nr:hypothetical protein [Klebsiella michiganensis]MDL4454963.1 hypothetical protein [Klebsiella michiganensis]